MSKSGTLPRSRTDRGQGSSSLNLPESYGAAGDGVTDDTTAIQTAIDYVWANGGGEVPFQAKCYRVGGTVGLTARSNVRLRGIITGYKYGTDPGNPGGGSMNLQEPDGTTITGFYGTILRLSDTAPAGTDLISTANFSTVIATTQGTAPYKGTWNFVIQDMTLDGNRGNATTAGWCLKMFGAMNRLFNVEVMRGKAGGIWSAFDSISTVTSGEPDNVWNRVYSHDNDGFGVLYMGPHDSYWHIGYSHRNAGADILACALARAAGIANWLCTTTVIKSENPVFYGLPSDGSVSGTVWNANASQTFAVATVTDNYTATVTGLTTAPQPGDHIYITPTSGAGDTPVAWHLNDVHVYSSSGASNRALLGMAIHSEDAQVVNCSMEGSTIAVYDMDGSVRMSNCRIFSPGFDDVAHATNSNTSSITGKASSGGSLTSVVKITGTSGTVAGASGGSTATLTASSSIFTANMVGMTVKVGNNSSTTISAYTNGTTVTMATAKTWSAGNAITVTSTDFNKTYRGGCVLVSPQTANQLPLVAQATITDCSTDALTATVVNSTSGKSASSGSSVNTVVSAAALFDQTMLGSTIRVGKQQSQIAYVSNSTTCTTQSAVIKATGGTTTAPTCGNSSTIPGPVAILTDTTSGIGTTTTALAITGKTLTNAMAGWPVHIGALGAITLNTVKDSQDGVLNGSNVSWGAGDAVSIVAPFTTNAFARWMVGCTIQDVQTNQVSLVTTYTSGATVGTIGGNYGGAKTSGTGSAVNTLTIDTGVLTSNMVGCTIQFASSSDAGVTATAAGSGTATLTASGAYFTAAMVGCTIQIGSSSGTTITGFTSSTVVTLAANQTWSNGDSIKIGTVITSVTDSTHCIVQHPLTWANATNVNIGFWVVPANGDILRVGLVQRANAFSPITPNATVGSPSTAFVASASNKFNAQMIGSLISNGTWTTRISGYVSTSAVTLAVAQTWLNSDTVTVWDDISIGLLAAPASGDIMNITNWNAQRGIRMGNANSPGGYQVFGTQITNCQYGALDVISTGGSGQLIGYSATGHETAGSIIGSTTPATTDLVLWSNRNSTGCSAGAYFQIPNTAMPTKSNTAATRFLSIPAVSGAPAAATANMVGAATYNGSAVALTYDVDNNKLYVGNNTPVAGIAWKSVPLT